MIGSLDELYDLYVKRWTVLNNNRSIFSSKQFDKMADTLYKSYCYDLDKYLLQRDIKDGQEVFNLRLRRVSYIPRRGFLWRLNIIGKLLANIHRKNFDSFIASMQLDIKNIEKDTADMKLKTDKLDKKLNEANKALLPAKRATKEKALVKGKD